MNPTSEDFQPRRDGWFEHQGTWEEVVVGTVIANRQRRSERWEIIDQALTAPIEYGHTLWMRAREQTSGEEFTVRPRPKTSKVVILTRDPADTSTGERALPSDAEAVRLLVESLGATALASRDNETGEILCPDYDAGHLAPGQSSGGMRAQMEHMRFAHGIDTTDLEALPFDERLRQVVTLHGRAHNAQHQAAINKGGFPHRHVPEDLTIFTGIIK